MRAVPALALALGLAVLGPTAASAATPVVHVTPNPVLAGKHVRLSGNADGCPAGDRVTLISRAFRHLHDFAGVPAVFAAVRPGGHFSKRTTIPRRRAAGRYTLTARCGGGNLGVLRHITVKRSKLARASAARLTAERIRIGVRPGVVRVVVDFRGAGTLQLGQVLLQDAARLFRAGAADVRLERANTRGRLATVRAHAVAVSVGRAGGFPQIAIRARAHRFKALEEHVLHGPERVVLDLWRASPPGAAATVRNDGCLTLDGVAAVPGHFSAHGRTLRRLFENALVLQVRSASGRIVGTEAVTAVRGRWSATVDYNVSRVQSGTLEAVVDSAKDGSLECLVQMGARLLVPPVIAARRGDQAIVRPPLTDSVWPVT